MIYTPVFENPLIDRADCTRALLDLVKPYQQLISPGHARIDPGPPGASFSRNATYLEGFARLLWGLVPLAAGGHAYEGWDGVLEGVSHGTDPEHPEFWGRPGDYDQLLVEMAVFGCALVQIPELIWNPLSQTAKKNFARWLASINRQKIPDCNWIFFRILVNCAFKRIGAPEYDEAQLRQSLQQVEKYHIGGGWYNDGYPEARRARDYYIPWAFHYYSLILATCCPDLIPDHRAVYLERAAAFAADYLYWFAEDGAALPYGRSLTYRYAEGAFWAALAFADCEALAWGRIKGLYLRHLRWWFRQPFFSETGLQTVGYRYPNLHMAERYNSPNSPLWALKAFIALAAPQNHPFWQAGEEPLDKQERTHVQPQTGLVLSDTPASGHLYALSAGQWTPGESNEHNHMAEKYAKFAYSVYFGFNVATDTFGIDKLGHDNMLLISMGDRFYRYRMETFGHAVSGECLCSAWKPFPGITITTCLGLAGAWSVRLHQVVSAAAFSTVEGGFALPYDDASYPLEPSRLHEPVQDESCWKTALGFSGLRNLGRPRQGRVVAANPNANIMHERTFIPSLLGEYPAGRHVLCCAALAHPDPDRGEKLWQRPQDFARIVDELKDRFKSSLEKNQGD
jgi:hypothetical protein